MIVKRPFNPDELLSLKPEALCSILSNQVVLLSQALDAMAEELKQLRAEIKA